MCVHADQVVDLKRVVADLELDDDPPYWDAKPGIWPGYLAMTYRAQGWAPRHFGFRQLRPGKKVAWRTTWLHNARWETLTTLPTWRKAWAQGRRCVLPVTSWYEPREGGGEWRFSRSDGPITYVGCLWRDPDEGMDHGCMSMVTIEPPPEIVDIHDRMPMPLNRQQAQAFIDPTSSPEAIREVSWVPLARDLHYEVSH